MAEKDIKSNGDELLINGSGKKVDGEVEANGVIEATPLKIAFPSCRHILLAMGFFAFINIYCLRVNLSVALVAMVDTEYIKQLNDGNTTSDLNSTSAEEVCETTSENSTNNATDMERGSFQWDTKQQGIILAAFFYGYTTTQVLGGTLAQHFGGKMLMLFGVFWTAILTLLTPVLTTYGGFPALIAVRVLEGIGEGVTFPSMHAMLSKWAPPLERSTMATAIYAGMVTDLQLFFVCTVLLGATMGTVIAMPSSGFLCKYWGWESVFYVFGVLGVIWSVLWFFLIYNSPATHPRISKAEREYIENAIGQKANSKGSISVPWLSVAKSGPVYALAVAHVCNNFGYYTLMTCLPQYLKFILKFDIKSNGIISGAPYLIMWFVITLSGFVCDRLRSRKIVSTTNVRKLANGLGFMLPAACLIATGYVNCNAPLAVALITIAVGLSGISFAGWSVNHLDLAPKYAGTLMGITNTLATVPGFVGPSIVGAITYKNQTRAAWRTVFYITGAIYLFGTIVYGIFGSGDVQPWSTDSKKTEEMYELKAGDDDKSKKDHDEEEKHVAA